MKNIKPGTVCLVVNSYIKQNNGKCVTVVEKRYPGYMPPELKSIKLAEDTLNNINKAADDFVAWIVTGNLFVTINWDTGKQESLSVKERAFPESCLIPINDPDLNMQEEFYQQKIDLLNQQIKNARKHVI